MSDTQGSTPPPAPSDEVQALLSVVFREEVGKVVGALLRILGNFAVAEEIVQDTLLLALERWPREGIPAQPGAWLMTVARHRAIDQLRLDDRPDRARLPGLRVGHRAATGASATEDRAGWHSLPCTP